MSLFDQVKKQLNRDQIAHKLSLNNADQKEALRRRLRAMERDGQLMFDQRKGYQLIDPRSLVTGAVSIHSDGFGFVSNPDLEKDLFVHKNQLNAVFDGDIVEVLVDARSDRHNSYNKLIRVVERKTTQIVGQLKRNGKQFYLIPDNRKISHKIDVDGHSLLNAETGQYVNTEIVDYPNYRNNTLVKITEVLGNAQDADMDIKLALCRHGISGEWNEALLDHADTLGIDVSDNDKASRVDYRHLPFVTIDGSDAKDFDDAVYCEKTVSGDWRLMVAIADVSHYVQPDDALDVEAQQRATSIYFPGHVVPMLPEALSNGLCSLNPNVDRLVMVCDMTINPQGVMTQSTFTEGLIHSHARLTYDQAYAVIAKQGSRLARKVNETTPDVVPHIENLHSLFGVLIAARKQRGAIDFETQEFKFNLTKKRKIASISPVNRNDAHRMIEEFMLCANVSTAKFLDHHKIPSLFRVHGGPQAKKLTLLRAFLLERGLSLGGAEKPTQSDYHQLLNSIGHRSDASVIRTQLLRSQSQAEYTADNQGHFGLAYDAYAHFTSPIRRYPDLLTHRAIRAKIRSAGSQKGTPQSGMQRALSWFGLSKRSGKSLSTKSYPYDKAAIAALALHCSEQSRQANDVSREVENGLKCQYMEQFKGESFVGTISGVTSFGFFVELDQGIAEGLVHISSLASEGLTFDAGKQQLSNGKVCYVLGDNIEVVLNKVDMKQQKMDFTVLASVNTEVA
ncbi:ribonuclease R [Alkalimarinus alittae]|uniref:Ribonuclease R n=2 Tax=Alkalimarinus alittae TaxID=2961619 RepID=A0ABY6N2B7_9ALTE|nr:ribonuclease R [Alkalimarinus alittae]